ncbi:MAG: hypothetical protein KF861_19540 [Planctomycetaceae bacterium]|nr:hypothetical protein [Planctomycetaceae bacterium]
MSPRGSKGGAEPQPDIYVGLLFAAAASLVTGIVFLVLELLKYDFRVP